MQQRIDCNERLEGELNRQQAVLRRAYCQLLIDLGESIMRCEKVETYITTNLFMFWAMDHTLPLLESVSRQEAVGAAVGFLQTYIASVLLFE